MDFSEYVRMAQRTSNTVEVEDKLLNGLMGLCGEVGEAMDVWKKVMFQGKQANKETLGHLRSELGDVAWYLGEALTAITDIMGGEPNDILLENIEKLKRRYPNGFSVQESENRRAGDV